MTITTEQLDSLISYTRQLADKGSPYAACNHTQLSELLERLKKAEASVAELEAEVRRLQPFDRVTEAERVRRAVTRAEKAEARVAELEGLRAGLMKDAIYQGHPDQHYGCVTYSQHGEDLFILNLFTLMGIKTGRYLDLGAHHPTDISNTRLLYERGWRGVNVEANPNLVTLFNAHRPEDVNLNFGVDSKRGVRELQMYNPTSGLNTFSNSEVESLKGVLTVRETLTCQMVTLDDIVRQHCGGQFPHFLNCDIEGLDFEVLASSELLASKGPLVVCVETRKNETATMREMFYSRAYSFVARTGENLIFVRWDFMPRCGF